MHRVLFLILMLLSASLHAQISADDEARLRREKIESILRLQDLRTPFDAKLVASLTDADPSVRLRATIAYGSLQDTSVIALLTRNLTDPDQKVQEAAAFALGQTGQMLSEAGRRQLEHDLIWTQIPLTGARGRLIEELGKFGTAQGLADLMTRVANVPPVLDPERLLMSMARFGIRGVVSDDAVRFALRYVQQGEQTPWQCLYALQRIGKHQETLREIENLRLQYKNRDPLVRMNLATLLGKLGDAGGASEILQRLADHDTDWRVRVNALKALATLPVQENQNVRETFRRAFYDANQHVSITALSSFPASGVDSSEIGYIASNASGGFPWQVQAEAAAALARIDHRMPRALQTSEGDLRPLLRARLLRIAGQSGDRNALPVLFAGAEASEPFIVNAALDGIESLARKSPSDLQLADSLIFIAIRLIGGHDVAVATTCAALLGDSLFRRPASVPALIASLAGMRPPHDTEAMQEIIATLGKFHDSRAMQPLIGLLGSPDPSVALASAAALKEMTGTDYSGRIERKPEPLYVDLDFAYLRSLPPLVRVVLKTSKGDIDIDLATTDAPFTVMAILKLASQRGYYRGLTFHRVVPNFVVQGGDPRGDGWGGPGFAIRSEFSMRAYETGTVGIASAGKDTEGSQFFITHSPQPHLDGRYTIIGSVVTGMDVVDRLQVDDRIYDIVVVR